MLRRTRTNRRRSSGRSESRHLGRQVWRSAIAFAVLGLAAGLVRASPQEANTSDEQSPAPPASEDAKKSELPAGVLARLNGRDISVEEYAGYLVATIGRAKLDEYIERLLIEEEADRVGVRIAPDDVEAMLAERLGRTVRSLYQGDRERFIAALKKRRSSLDEYKARWRQKIYYEMLTDSLVRRDRKVTPNAIQAEFERVYGEGGVQHVLRHILISKRLRDENGLVRSESEARERANRVRKELQAGLEFSQAVKQYSDDALTRKNDGRIAHYQREYFGEDFHQRVLQLSPAQRLSGVIASARGFHIVELIDRRETSLSDVESQLSEHLRSKPASAEERQALLKRLRGAAKLEGLE